MEDVEDPSLAPPVFTVGLHGSASTWVFNIARELLLSAFGEARLYYGYADQTSQLPPLVTRAGKVLVIKSHHGSLELDTWIKRKGARVLLTIRDPRDAAISVCQRFHAPLADAVVWLARECERVARLMDEGHTVFRYEDKFFDNPSSIEQISQLLTLPPNAAPVEAIFDRYRREAVRDFAARLASLPVERIALIGKFKMDRVTQILQPHIGDGRVGKWRELAPKTSRELTSRFRVQLERLGYSAD